MKKFNEYWIDNVNNKFESQEYQVVERTYEHIKGLIEGQMSKGTQSRIVAYDGRFAHQLADKIYNTGTTHTPIIVVVNGIERILIEGRHRCEALRHINENLGKYINGERTKIKIIEIPISDFNGDLSIARKWAIQHQSRKAMTKPYSEEDIDLELRRDLENGIDIEDTTYLQELKSLFNCGNMIPINRALNRVLSKDEIVQFYVYDKNELQKIADTYEDKSVVWTIGGRGLTQPMGSILIKMYEEGNEEGVILVHYTDYKKHESDKRDTIRAADVMKNFGIPVQIVELPLNGEWRK